MYEVKEHLKEKVILVTIARYKDEQKGWDAEDTRDELYALALSSGVQVIDGIICNRDEFTPNLLVGKGKAEEIHDLIHAHDENVDAVLFSENLSSTQQRNLEDVLGVKTIDRTQLILDVFAKRARTNEGKLQVEYAQLEYLLPRLVGKGIMLSRLGGGIGTIGPGEQKLEVDRRRIKARITKLKKDIEEVRHRRARLRKNRLEHSVATVAVIGYTNAGKSTLLNNLTDSHILADNKLFATLDPTARRFILPNKQKILLVDTVGFIHNLPHNLVEAFKATLEEVREADLLLHVMDISSPKADEQREAVNEVLKELDADKKPMITALNKIDILDNKYMIRRFQNEIPDSVAVSALNSTGFKMLIDAIAAELTSLVETVDVLISHNKMALLNEIYKEGKVLERRDTAKGIHIKAIIPLRLKFKFK